jgi:hypothetical protein
MENVMSKKNPERIIAFRMTEAEYREMENDNMGACLGCGAEADGCEPDACGYTCESCDEKKVYGVPELLMMGRVQFVSEPKAEEVPAGS